MDITQTLVTMFVSSDISTYRIWLKAYHAQVKLKQHRYWYMNLTPY
jgi:hypothetical protein